MIRQETIDDRFIRTYSDAGFMIHGGSPEGDYEEAIDPIGSGRTYVETDIPIEEDGEVTPEELAAAIEEVI